MNHPSPPHAPADPNPAGAPGATLNPGVHLTPLRAGIPAEGGIVDVLLRVQAPERPAGAEAPERTPLRLALVVATCSMPAGSQGAYSVCGPARARRGAPELCPWPLRRVLPVRRHGCANRAHPARCARPACAVRLIHAAGIRSIPQFTVERYDLDLAVIVGSRKLDIEVDGERYHRTWTGELCLRDQLRNQRLIELGWEVRRFWVYQVRDELEACVQGVVKWVAGAGGVAPGKAA